MDECTIIEFQNCMMHPEVCFHRLKEAMFDLETLKRTKYFAECRADIDGEPVMLYAPITPLSLAMAHNANSAIAPQCRHLQRLEIMEDEMLCTGFGKRYCPIIIERLPEGILLRDALYTHTISTLKRGFESLRNELENHDISINHLHPDSIIIDNALRWHVIREYYATRGYGNDTEAFNKILELISRYAMTDRVPQYDSLHEEFAPYDFGNKREVYPICEGLRRYKDEDSIGFEDRGGTVVIPAQYKSATDFKEDRSIVENHDHKWGIIDKRGRYIIDMLYDSVEFNLDDGTSEVTLDNKRATFDYFGTRITPWV